MAEKTKITNKKYRKGLGILLNYPKNVENPVVLCETFKKEIYYHHKRAKHLILQFIHDKYLSEEDNMLIINKEYILKALCE